MHNAILHRAVYFIGIAIVVIVPLTIKSSYIMGVLNMGLIMAIAALGLNVVKGYCGLINAGHAGFWGIGAYAAALLATKIGWPFILTIPVAVIISVLVGLFLGIVALRLKGMYFAMLTIGFAVIVQLILSNWVSLTHGQDGITDIPLPDFGLFKLTSPQHVYLLLLGLTVLIIWFCIRIERTKYGRTMKAISGNELATELMGVNTFYEKTLALCISAGLGGFSGALLAHAAQYVSPVQFGFEQSVLFMVMLVLGGIGTVPGAVLGALVLTFLPEFLRPLRYWNMTIFGALVCFMILVVPGGFISLAQRVPMLSRLLSQHKEKKGLSHDNSSKVSIQSLSISTRDEVIPRNQPVLQVKNLSISFGGLNALNNVEIELFPGQVHALIGPNGAGKSTFVNCLTGAYKPDKGTVSLSGSSIMGLKPYQIARLGVSRTFQNLALWKELSVMDNLLVAKRGFQNQGFWSVIFGTKAARSEEAEARSKASDFITAMGLWSEKDRKVGTLAYGHQKIFEIIRALMTSPKVLLLDEPAAGLTLPELTQLKQLIQTMKRKGVAILLIEHNMQLVMDIADTITVLNHGTVIDSGNPQSVRNNPEVIKAYLGAEDLTFRKREVKQHV